MSNSALQFTDNVDELLDCNDSINIADKITELILKKDFAESETDSIVYEVLINQRGYAAKSLNLTNSITDADVIFNSLSKWKACDIVLLYHHPDLGSLTINPKNPDHKELLADLKRNELVVVYVGYASKKDADDLCKTMAEKCLDVLNGKKVTPPDSFLKGSFVYKKAAAPVKKVKAVAKTSTKAPAKTSSKKIVFNTSGDVKKTAVSSSTSSKPVVQQSNPSLRKMSPMVSVPVTNELFHNGNVEAWKKIIASYTSKYPALQVFVYYDGERITDINTLFKWGKVKHGSCIQFVVAGENIQDVAKLKRYFAQGASPMFEAFLKGAPGTILPLF